MIYLDSSFVLSYLFKDSMYDYAKDILESNEKFWSSDLLRYECLVSLQKRFPSGDSERTRGFEELKKKIEFLSIHSEVYQNLFRSSKSWNLKFKEKWIYLQENLSLPTYCL